MSSPAWQIFDLKALTARGHQGNVDYQEFLREPTMSCGIYYVKAGSTDMQGYHDEDELYVVIEGRGSLRVGDEAREVGPGAIMYVRASEEHAFFEVQEDMTMLVLFAAPRSGMR
ncbi:MAG TPA: cupin domain-containing protein [Porticoccaceae bacterium]|nr:cupin domain-containing protein [Porticoccaceae bacterium]